MGFVIATFDYRRVAYKPVPCSLFITRILFVTNPSGETSELVNLETNLANECVLRVVDPIPYGSMATVWEGT